MRIIRHETNRVEFGGNNNNAVLMALTRNEIRKRLADTARAAFLFERYQPVACSNCH